MNHFPKGCRYTALERNLMKYRAFEMVLILHHVQQLRRFVVQSVRGTERLRVGPPRNPDSTTRLESWAFGLLVEDGILSEEESREVRDLIDYRNHIAHEAERLTVDLNRSWTRDGLGAWSEYRSDALSRIDVLRRKIEDGMSSEYVLYLDFRPLAFEPVERVYREELARLRKKIKRQIRSLRRDIEQVNSNIAFVRRSLLDNLQPSHPRHRNSNGTLSPDGIQCCYALFEAGAIPESVAHLMRLSLRSAKARHARWIAQDE